MGEDAVRFRLRPRRPAAAAPFSSRRFCASMMSSKLIMLWLVQKHQPTQPLRCPTLKSAMCLSPDPTSSLIDRCITMEILHLPTELLLKIPRLVLVCKEPIHVNYAHCNDPFVRDARSVIRTCWHLHKLSMPILYGENTFAFLRGYYLA